MENHSEFRLTNSLADEMEAAYREAKDTFVIADLGCGKGLYHEDIEETLSGLGDKDVEIIGFDINRDSLEYTEETDAAQTDLVEYGMPLDDSSVDFVYSNHLRCQIPEKDLKEIEKEGARVLQEHGRQYHRC